MNTTNKLLLALLVLVFIQTSIQLFNFLRPHFGSRMMVKENKSSEVSAIKSIPDLPKTIIQFDSVIHNFGIIQDDKKQYTVFEFTNTGKEPLMILAAEGSCGCTVPSWPRDPIAPGKSAKIEVSFDPNGKSGEQSKIVTVTSNTEPTTTILTITATIVKSN